MSGEKAADRRNAHRNRWDVRDEQQRGSRVVDRKTPEFRAAYYAEDTRRRERAREELESRSWVFTVDSGIGRWARGWVVGPPESLPLRRSTFGDWSELLGLRGSRLEIETVVQTLIARAVADAMVTFPGPGVFDTAYSTRDEWTERTDGVGFGFYPPDTDELIIHGSSALKYDAFDARPEVGADAVVAAIHLVMDAFIDPSPGHRQPSHRWQPAE
ncbi:hypothetical protein ACWDOP_30125 [Nocardia sp. NPDC003693]